jgi:hypothetical protein
VRPWFGRDEGPPTSGVSPIRAKIALFGENFEESMRGFRLVRRTGL